MVGIKGKFTPPAIDEIEVTLLGGVTGFGECILVHIGNGDWICVDCCININTGNCIPLEYLNEIGVNVSNHLLYIICTHWHDDHIKGLSQLISACSSNTKFALSCSDDREKFIFELLKDIDYQGKSKVLDELNETFKILNVKNIEIKRLKQDIFIFDINNIKAYALSPGEFIIEALDREIATAQRNYHRILQQLQTVKFIDKSLIVDANNIECKTMNELSRLINDKIDNIEEPNEIDNSSSEDLLKFKDTRKINQNNRCVVLQISFNNHNIILGADLEDTMSSNGVTAWQIVANSTSLKGITSSLFKIPHHGSVTGYCEKFINRFIKPDATMKLTGWTLGDKAIPEKKMLQKYYSHSKELYITTTKTLKKINTEKNKFIKKEMDKTTDAIYEIPSEIGIIRSRMKINSTNDKWNTDCFGSAVKISPEYLI